MIRKESSEGIGYSVVEQHSIRHVFAAAVILYTTYGGFRAVVWTEHVTPAFVEKQGAARG